MEERSAAKSHKIILGNRRTGNFTGVRDVISFDPKEILFRDRNGNASDQRRGPPRQPPDT